MGNLDNLASGEQREQAVIVRWLLNNVKMTDEVSVVVIQSGKSHRSAPLSADLISTRLTKFYALLYLRYKL